MSPDLLEEILVETRPAPDPAWAAEMDQLVERGFERESDSPSRSSWRARFAGWRPMLVPALGTAASVLLVVVIAVSWPATGDDNEEGFVSGGGEVSQSDTDGGGGSAASTGATAEKAPPAADSAGGVSLRDEAARGQLAPSVPGGAVPGENRKVERFASLTLTAPPREIAQLGDAVIRVTDRLGGYVASSTVSASDGGGGGSFELKLPVRRLDRAMAELSKLAHVSERSQATQDITGEFNSARALVREAKAERESLLRQLAAADTVNETASIRARLRIVANELDGARRMSRQVNRRASFATVSVTLAADPDAPGAGEDDEGGWTPGDAINDAGRVLEVAAGVAIIALAAAVPLGLLALLALLVARWTVRRRREAALDTGA